MFKCVLNKHLNTFDLLQSEPQASTKALCAVDGQPAIVQVVVHPANALALVLWSGCAGREQIKNSATCRWFG